MRRRRRSGTSPVELSVFDAAGRLIYSENLGELPAGDRQVQLNGNRFPRTEAQYFLIRLESRHTRRWARVVMRR